MSPFICVTGAKTVMELLPENKDTHLVDPVGLRIMSSPEKQTTKGFTRKFAIVGEDVVLPCSSGNGESLKNEVVHWKNKDDKDVFAYERGHYDVNCSCHDEQYRGRVSLFFDKLNEGNASMMLRGARIEDAGNYTCNLSNVFPESTTTEIFFNSGAPRKYVTEGDDVILPCFARNRKNLKKTVIQWKNTYNKDVFRQQDEQYRGRVSLFPTELKKGNASMQLKAVRVADAGNYTCLLSNAWPESSTTELIVKKKMHSLPGTDMLFAGVWVPVILCVLVLLMVVTLIRSVIKRHRGRGKTRDIWMEMGSRKEMEAWEVKEIL